MTRTATRLFILHHIYCSLVFCFEFFLWIPADASVWHLDSLFIAIHDTTYVTVTVFPGSWSLYLPSLPPSHSFLFALVFPSIRYHTLLCLTQNHCVSYFGLSPP